MMGTPLVVSNRSRVYHTTSIFATQPCRPHLKARNNSWKVDETSIKIKKVWMYLYRAVDSEGNTLEFLLSPTRDAQAAKRFFLKALSFTAESVPQDGLAQEEAVKEPSLEEGAEAIAPTGVEVSRTMPRVIHVDTNAASPKAIAELKAAGVLPESVELKPGEMAVLQKNGEERRGHVLPCSVELRLLL
jgi:transposase, IS6 family